MKKLIVVTSLCAFAAFAGTSLVQAQSTQTQVDPEAAAGLDNSRPDRPSRTAPQFDIEYALRALPRAEANHAGAPDAKDMKSVAPASTSSDTDEWFSAPAAYSEYKFAQIQDNRNLGYDGPQHNATVGFDFESYCKTIVGFNFTYTNESLFSQGGGAPATNFYNSSNSYFFSSYIAKNFEDWINVGGSVTYGRSDTEWRANILPPFAFAVGQDTTQDSVGLSPFIGVSHTWGPYSFSSTTAYIWAYDHYEFDLPTTNGSVAPGTAAIPDAKALNQTFLWLNNFQYAVDDKWSLSVQANWNRLLTIQSVPNPLSPAIPPLGHQWMSFGGKVEYAFNKDGNVFVQFEHDAFNIHFDDYRIRTGVSYNF